MGWGAVLGGALGGVTELIGQDMANDESKASSKRMMAFQERMSSSAHQRQMADMRLAGLNPILSAGGGASSPSGSSYVAQNVAEGTASNALNMVRLKEEVNSIRAAVSKANADAAVAREMEKTQQGVQELNRAQIRETNARASVEEAESFSAGNRVAFESKHPEVFGVIDAIGKRLGIIGGSAQSLLGSGAALKYLLKGNRAQPGNDVGDFDLRRGPRVSDAEFYRRDKKGNLRRPR